MRGGSVGASVRGPESQEGACESLKGPIAQAIDVFFGCFLSLCVCVCVWGVQLLLVFLTNNYVKFTYIFEFWLLIIDRFYWTSNLQF